jgi:hypothetical protein
MTANMHGIVREKRKAAHDCDAECEVPWQHKIGQMSDRQRRPPTQQPKHDAFQRSFVRLTPQTLKAVNDLVVRAAVELGLEDGAKLRVDTTVVQTDIHPTDNTLLWDVVRVVTRLVGRLCGSRAHQQPDANRGPAGQTIVWQPKGRVTTFGSCIGQAIAAAAHSV